MNNVVKLDTQTPGAISFILRVSSADDLSSYTVDKAITVVINNEPPAFGEGLVSEIEVSAVIDLLGNLESAETYKYNSPFVTDRESQAIKFQFNGVENTPVKVTPFDKYFTLEISRTRITESNSGIYTLQVKYKDQASLTWR